MSSAGQRSRVDANGRVAGGRSRWTGIRSPDGGRASSSDGEGVERRVAALSSGGITCLLWLPAGRFPPSARPASGGELAIRRALKNKEGIAACLEGLAAAAGAVGQLEQAARLFGAAEALRESLGASLPPAERADHDRQSAAVRAALGQPEFAAAWAQGREQP